MVFLEGNSRCRANTHVYKVLLSETVPLWVNLLAGANDLAACHYFAVSTPPSTVQSVSNCTIKYYAATATTEYDCDIRSTSYLLVFT